MKLLLFLVISASWLVFDSAYATSFGVRGVGVIVSINDKPAICIPSKAKNAFAVRHVSLTESNRRNPASWGASLLPGLKPLELSPGDCMVWGSVPWGYEYDNYLISARALELEINRTYVFSVHDAYRPTDSYDAVFCVSKTATGTLEYLQYTRSATGAEVTPSCGTRRSVTMPSN